MMPSGESTEDISNSRSKVCVKYAGPMEIWNDALVATCEGQSRRRLSHPRLSANPAMLRTACFLCVIGHRELLLAPDVPYEKNSLGLPIANDGLSGLFAIIEADLKSFHTR